MTTELEMAKNGEFLREYGKQYFVVASEALNIGRVKWNMVPIGKSGQGDIAFYLTTEQMLALCNEIGSGVFAKKIAADTANYPSAYRYVTGDDGCLHLNIGGGKMGCRIQMQDASKKTTYLMAVSVEALKTMATKYLLCTGMIPIAPGSYYAGIVSAFEGGRVERAKFRKNPPEGLTDVVDTNSVIDESVEAEMKVEEKAEKKPEPVANKVDEPETPKVDAPQAETKDENYKLVIHGPKSIEKGFYVFAGKDEDGNEISLMFRKADAEKLNWFAKFENAAALGETKLAISGERKNKYILYKGHVKK